MEISPAIIANPGVFHADDERKRTITNYKKAVDGSSFLSNEQKRNWKLMGYYLSTPDLQIVKGEILKENLKRLKVQHQLERLKTKET